MKRLLLVFLVALTTTAACAERCTFHGDSHRIYVPAANVDWPGSDVIPDNHAFEHNRIVEIIDYSEQLEEIERRLSGVQRQVTILHAKNLALEARVVALEKKVALTKTGKK